MRERWCNLRGCGAFPKCKAYLSTTWHARREVRREVDQMLTSVVSICHFKVLRILLWLLCIYVSIWFYSSLEFASDKIDSMCLIKTLNLESWILNLKSWIPSPESWNLTLSVSNSCSSHSPQSSVLSYGSWVDVVSVLIGNDIKHETACCQNIKDMKLIVITTPQSSPGEHAIFSKIIDTGIHAFHLRRPNWDVQQMRECCQGFSKAQRSKIVLHSCHELVEEQQLKASLWVTSTVQKRPEDYGFSLTKCRLFMVVDSSAEEQFTRISLGNCPVLAAAKL